jgi:hypothetical protein
MHPNYVNVDVTCEPVALPFWYHDYWSIVSRFLFFWWVEAGAVGLNDRYRTHYLKKQLHWGRFC